MNIGINYQPQLVFYLISEPSTASPCFLSAGAKQQKQETPGYSHGTGWVGKKILNDYESMYRMYRFKMIHRYLGHCLGWFDLLIWDDLSDWTAYICVVGTVWVEFSMCSYVLNFGRDAFLEATFSGDMSVVLRIVGFRSRDTSIPCKSQTVKK